MGKTREQSRSRTANDPGRRPRHLIDVRVWATYWYVAGGGPRASLPEAAQQFIADFDADIPVEPFSFTIPEKGD